MPSPDTTGVAYDGRIHTLTLNYPVNVDPAKIFGSASVSGTNAGIYTVRPDFYSNQQGYDLITGPLILVITPRNLTITANAQSRAYGNANPALTYSVGGLGLVHEDTQAGSLATARRGYASVAPAGARGILPYAGPAPPANRTWHNDEHLPRTA